MFFNLLFQWIAINLVINQLFLVKRQGILLISKK